MRDKIFNGTMRMLKWREKFLDWVAHHPKLSGVLVLVWSLWLMLANIAERPPIWQYILLVVELWLFWFGYISTQALHRSKNSNLCEKCVYFPDDPEKTIKRKKPILKLVHLFGDTVGRFGKKPGVVFALLNVPWLIYWGTDWGPTWLRVGGLVFWVIFAYPPWIGLTTHIRLAPWCPYCRGWEDDGDTEPSPNPLIFGLKVR